MKVYQRSLTEVCTWQPRAIGCVGPCALCLGSIAHARSVVFCQPMTALTRTGRQRCPKGAPYERVSGQSHASRAAWLTTEALGWGICIYCAFYAAWLTTEVLGRGVCVCYATREGVLIAERSVARRGSDLSCEEPCEGVASRQTRLQRP